METSSEMHALDLSSPQHKKTIAWYYLERRKKLSSKQRTELDVDVKQVWTLSC
jgi:hypothetical protein